MISRTPKLILAALSLILPLTAWSGGQVKSFHVEFESEKFLSSGDVLITQADVDAFLEERVPQADRAVLLSSPDRIAELLNGLLLVELFLPLASEAGLLDDEIMQARLYRLMLNEIRGIYREHYLDEIRLESYETAARELYLTRGRDFTHPDTIDFEHILVAVNPERSEVEAMKRILDLHERLNDGEEFAELAASYSDDPSVRENRGLMSNVVPSTLVSQLAAILGETPVGRYSDPIRSRFGWHLVRLIEVHPGKQMEWEEARERAERIARDRHMTLAWERLLRDVQDQPVELADGAVATLLQRYGLSSDDAGHLKSVERLLEDD